MVATQRWLDSRGVYYQLADRYVRGGWFQRLADGVYCRAGDRPSWAGAVHALQVHDAHCIYPGGKAALVMLGHGHFVHRSASKLTLFGPPASRLPKWFAHHDWGLEIEYRTNVLFDDVALGLSKRDIDGFQIQLSGAERAMLEMLLDVPGKVAVGDASAIIRGLTTLRPKTVQQLLESCRSVKVKRLALLFAEYSEHSWRDKLSLERVDLGSGKRVLGGGGHYYSAYQLSLPESLESAGDSA